MASIGRKTAGRLAGLGLSAMLLSAVGCGAFFQCEGKSSCSTGGTTTTGDVVFVGNENSADIYAYNVASAGGLKEVSGSPTTLSSEPTSMAVTPDDSLLYVAEASGTIYSYVVSTAGVLSNATQQAVATVQSASIAISPDGNWLVSLDYVPYGSTTVPYVRLYSIGTGGVLANSKTAVGFAITSPSQTVTSYQVAFSPSGNYVGVALGAAGTLVIPFTTSTGAFGSSVALGGNSSSVSDDALAFDGNDNVYIARDGSNANTVTTYSATGTLLSGPTAVGGGPRALQFASSYAFLYTANLADGTITANSVSSAQAVTAIGSATTAPTSVQALAVDSTGKVLLSAGTSASAGLETFVIGTSGGLSAGSTAVTGAANGIPVLTATH